MSAETTASAMSQSVPKLTERLARENITTIVLVLLVAGLGWFSWSVTSTLIDISRTNSAVIERNNSVIEKLNERIERQTFELVDYGRRLERLEMELHAYGRKKEYSE